MPADRTYDREASPARESQLRSLNKSRKVRSLARMLFNGNAALAAAILCAGLLPAHAWTQASPCGDLLNLKIDNTIIAEAIDIPAGKPLVAPNAIGQPVPINSLPRHCLVHGEVNRHKAAYGKEYGDKFEIRMPANWEGRLLFVGGGGLDGILHPAIGLQAGETTDGSKSALGIGFVVITTDGGHQASNPMGVDAEFGSDPEARADYNYRSTKLVTDVARRIIARFYGSETKYSYFMGCSNGGREGLMAGERYPNTFDGIVAGAPAFNLTNAAMAQAWSTVQLASIAPRNADAAPDLAQSLTTSDLKLLVHAVLDKCDALDGLKDGMIFNPEACQFDPAVLQCKAGPAAECLSAQKVQVIRRIFEGPHNSAGKAIYSKWPYDAGDASDGWRAWMTGTGSTPSINVMIFPTFFNGLALAGASPPIDIYKFNFDSDPERINKAAREINADATDWSPFRKHKGKLLLYTGMSDPVFSALDLIHYYKQVEQQNGGEERAQEFARLFLVPGMPHCGGAPGLDHFDLLSAIRDWVEEGKAPQNITASGSAFPGRTRPLCPFPSVTMYKGAGIPEDAANFTCRIP